MKTARAKTASVEVYGWEGVGPTKADAKADAVAKIQQASEGSYTPTLFVWRGHIGLVWREALGWWSTVRTPDRLGKVERTYGAGTYATETEALRSMLRHIAQNGWTVADGIEAPEFLKDANDRKEHSDWARWQTVYARRRAERPDETKDETWSWTSENYRSVAL